MKKLLSAIAVWAALLSPALAANVNIDALPAAASVGGTDLLECEQSGTNRQCTAAQTAAYVYGLMSGDATTSGTGTITFATVNANVGSFGSATNCVALTVNAKGLITAASATTCTPAVGSITGLGTGVATWLATPSSANLAAAVTGETGSGALVFGTAPTISSPTINTAATFGFITGSTQCLTVDTSGVLSGSGAPCGGTATAVPSVQTGTNYAFQGTDLTKVIYLSNASPQVPTIAQAGTGSFTNGWYATACNIGAGTQTITPATSTIGGAATFVLPAGSAARPNCAGIISDGTNYVVVPDFGMDASTFSAGTLAAARGGAGTINGALKGNGSGVVSQAACADLSNGTALCSTTPGTGVATAAAANLSAAGGLSTTVASGTSALGTSAISSATCATVVTTSATNTATTDVIWWGFNGDPTAVTGYVPLVAGMLTIIAYPSANNVNFKVCNNTSGSITPGAITLNWRVIR